MLIAISLAVLAVAFLMNAKKIILKYKRLSNGWAGCCGHNIPNKEFHILGPQATLLLIATCPICKTHNYKFLVNQWESNNKEKWNLPKKGTAPDETIKSAEKLMNELTKSVEPMGHLYEVQKDGSTVKIG